MSVQFCHVPSPAWSHQNLQKGWCSTALLICTCLLSITLVSMEQCVHAASISSKTNLKIWSCLMQISNDHDNLFI